MNEKKVNVTILTEGNTRTNGVNSPPTTPKPNVTPAGQQTTSSQNGSQTTATSSGDSKR